jgi:hypothetical protein
MKTDLKIDGVMVLTGAAILAALGVAYLVKKKGSDIVDAINPASDKNIVYQSAGGLGKMLGMDKNDTVGTGIYNYLHKQYNPNDLSTVGEPVNWWNVVKVAGAVVNPIAVVSGLANIGMTPKPQEDYMRDDIFDMPRDTSSDTWLYTSDSPVGQGVGYVKGLFAPKDEFTTDNFVDPTAGW